jgi:hypothetical protein
MDTSFQNVMPAKVTCKEHQVVKKSFHHFGADNIQNGNKVLLILSAGMLQ